MEPAHHSDEYADNLGLERLIFFSDAVFAIAITLLVLDIRLPSNVSEDLIKQDLPDYVLNLLPQIVGYAIGFMVLGAYWFGHHRIFRYIRGYDGGLLWLNLVFLMTVAFLPFPTSLIGQYGDTPFAVCFYASSVALAGVLSSALWIYATRHHRLVDATLNPQAIRYQTARGLATVAVFLVSIPVALVWSPYAAEFFWLLLIFVRPILRLVPTINAPRSALKP